MFFCFQVLTVKPILMNVSTIPVNTDLHVRIASTLMTVCVPQDIRGIDVKLILMNVKYGPVKMVLHVLTK